MPFAVHHQEFWEWVWALEKGAVPPAFIGIWSRGGAKSTSVEMACVAVGARKSRKYILYTCETQQQADDHVQNVGTMLESSVVEQYYPELASRELNKYGNSKGWRRNRLRTASGLTIDAIGLDTASRGIKMDEDRPDLIILDDVDDSSDNAKTTIPKKITALTQKILPAGSEDCAVLAVQNLVHPEGIFARLAGIASVEADFLSNRVVSGPHPALLGLLTEPVPGTTKHKIVAGTPTWAGQDVDACQGLLDRIGIRAFKLECQHEKQRPDLPAFPEWDESVHVCDPFPIPAQWPKWRAIDWGYASPFCGLWLTRAPAGTIYAYREVYETRMATPQQALLVRSLSAGEVYRGTVADPAMWASHREGRQIKAAASEYTEMGVPLQKANNDRLAGKAKVHELLEWAEGAPPTLQVFRPAYRNNVLIAGCPNLIREMPLLVPDPHRPEDVETDSSDHAFDSLKYGTLAIASTTTAQPPTPYGWNRGRK